MKKINQKGFAIIEVLIVVLVVALLGGVGAYVYHKNHKSAPAAGRSSASTATQKTLPTTQPVGNVPVATSSNDDTGYLVIKEWGIKIQLDDADKLTYTMNGTPNGSPNADATTSYATLQFNNTVAVPAACKDGKNIGISISQLTAATNATKIDNYYYGIEGGTVNACGDSATDALKQKILSQEVVPNAITAE